MSRISKAAFATVFAAALVAGAGAASAGEVTGSNKTKEVVANSECAFSGLEDNDGLSPVVPGVTQNWGQIPAAVRAELRAVGVSPGALCNGHLNPIKGLTPEQ